MDQIADLRLDIYNYFHRNAGCQSFFLASANEARYASYYTSMYLLQDTAESLTHHRSTGFSANPFQAYIEFWGVMQALIVQQDSICELHSAVTGQQLRTESLPSWQSLRTIRNKCAGHPSRKDRPKGSPITRTFMPRGFGDYNRITFEQWESGSGISHPVVALGTLIESYTAEGAVQLSAILQSMKNQWP